MTQYDREQAISLVVQAFGFHRSELERKSDEEIYVILQRAQRFIHWEE